MTNWQACKHSFLMALQNDAAKKSLRRSNAVNNPRTCNSATNLNKGKGPAILPHFKRPHNSHNMPRSRGNSGNIGGDDCRGASSNKGVY